MNEYTKQAENFLQKNCIEFNAKKSAIDSPPLWVKKGEKHGMKYDIELSKNSGRDKFFLNFWGSIAEAEAVRFGERNAKRINAYDVLACITKNDVGTLWDFIADYGYEATEETEKTYRAVVEEWGKVKGFFTEKELEELREIQ